MSAEKITAEVAIIGSGVAGAMVAWKLASLGIKNIVMVEAGPRIKRGDIVEGFKASPLTDFSAGYPNTAHAPRPDWNNKDKPYIDNIGAVAARTEYIRAVGGTTWHWSGITPRFLPADFRLKSEYGVGVDWPVGYTALEPFYTEAETEMGVAGDDGEDTGAPRSAKYPLPPVPRSYSDKHIVGKLQGMGLDFITCPAARATKPYRGRGQCQGFGTCSPICPSGAQYGAVYHVEAAEKLGVRVIGNLRADRIVAKDRATQITARRPDGAEVNITAKIFVVAANGIETPRLLLMSAGESVPAGIANSSGAVGRNFMDHPSIFCSLLLKEPVWPGRGPETIIASNTYRDGAFRRERAGWILGVGNRADFHNTTDSLLAQGVAPRDLQGRIRDQLQRQVGLSASLEQLPDAGNGITLDWGRRDTAGQPVIRHAYSYSDYERKGYAHAKAELEKAAKALDADIVWMSPLSAVSHPMGMARMGDDKKTSVTDSFGRCHDHANLFIAGSALFPSSSAANPTLTIAALAVRTAGEIARQLKS
jgi:choline dehydrogenase-like flavoprotein